MSTEAENQQQDQAPPNKYLQMLTDALADPNTPEETRREILDSQAKLAAQKAGGEYVPVNRYAHHAPDKKSPS